MGSRRTGVQFRRSESAPRALHNRVPYNTSPYLPLSVYYKKSLIYLDIERVPEFESSRCAQALLQSPRIQQRIERARNAEFIEYEEVASLKRHFLKLLFREFARRKDSDRTRAFAEYCRCEGDLLEKLGILRARRTPAQTRPQPLDLA